MTPEVLIPGVVAGTVSLLVPLVLRPILERRAVLDLPNDRSSHSAPTLRGGGIAQLLGVLVALVAVHILALDETNRWMMDIIIIGSGAMAGIGLLDDLSRGRGPSPLVRAGLQLAISLATTWLLLSRGDDSVWWVLVAAFFITAYVNFANFMDGVNWISGLHGLVVGATFAVIGWQSSQEWLVVLGLVIAAAYAAFLPWNILGTGMFLGDVGSYLLGSLIGASVIAGIAAGIPVGVMVSPLALYLADTLTALARRVLRREPVLQAHRTHSYQRLTNTGFSHRAVALTVALLSAATGFFGLLYLRGSWPGWLSTAAIALVCVAYVGLPRALGDRLPSRPAAPPAL